MRDTVGHIIYGSPATGTIPLLAQCPPPQWAVQNFSATAQWFEMGDRQHPHRVKSSGKAEIIQAYLSEQGQQVSAGLWDKLPEAHSRLDRRRAFGQSKALCPSAMFLLRSSQGSARTTLVSCQSAGPRSRTGRPSYFRGETTTIGPSGCGTLQHRSCTSWTPPLLLRCPWGSRPL